MCCTDPRVEPLARALATAARVLEQVTPEQASRPTPCASYDVRALVEHLICDVEMFTAMVCPESAPQPPAPTGSDWTSAYRTAADSLLAVWSLPDALDRTIELPFGQATAHWALEQQTAGVIVHAWDLARATGQPTEFDPQLGQRVLAWGRDNIPAQLRGTEADGAPFAPPVPVHPSAALYDQLAGVFGRDPTTGDSRATSPAATATKTAFSPAHPPLAAGKKPSMSLEDMRRPTAGSRRARLTTVAGWMALTYGAVHVVVVPLRRRENLSQAWAEGWWNAFTLNEPTTLAEAERAVTFWQTLGSFGFPTLALGGHVVWSALQRRRVPGWLGGIVLAWGLPFVTALPASPGWALPVIGGLIIAGDTGGRGPEPGAGQEAGQEGGLTRAGQQR